jgi:hypothetical protein
LELPYKNEKEHKLRQSVKGSKDYGKQGIFKILFK